MITAAARTDPEPRPCGNTRTHERICRGALVPRRCHDELLYDRTVGKPGRDDHLPPKGASAHASEHRWVWRRAFRADSAIRSRSGLARSFVRFWTAVRLLEHGHKNHRSSLGENDSEVDRCRRRAVGWVEYKRARGPSTGHVLEQRRGGFSSCGSSWTARDPRHRPGAGCGARCRPGDRRPL